MVNVEEDNLKHHLIFRAANDIQCIAKPLEKYGITHFSYSRLDADDGRIYLSTHPLYAELFIKEKLYKVHAGAAYDAYHSGYYLADLFDLDKDFIAASHSFGLWHYFIILKRNIDHTEFFYFGAPVSSHHINHFYLNNITILESFCALFKEKAAKPIANYEAHRLLYPHGSDNEILLNANLSVVQNGSSYMHFKQRELNCLHYLKLGILRKKLRKH